jgi:hypothetical protein
MDTKILYVTLLKNDLPIFLSSWTVSNCCCTPKIQNLKSPVLPNAHVAVKVLESFAINITFIYETCYNLTILNGNNTKTSRYGY